ncbi:glutamate-5-semialdehyde dehydrogenase [Qipengyuania sp. XHP0207]|uniref:glutamate-5-semialdehyde dehydrogenase n=1 Tax=Qipengyuania sp. XHP0207 TaxID=3038078 RepID=UPI0024201698|nr:glutamate-5-semialdehyde dehydrogenase [Qipengyuania sp. XHP0207]MDG5747376.1 glutamate-5-semialdehyde dehydrogenase [Qipengyuania sp. XHP0207]
MTDQKLDPQIHVHELGSRARDAARKLAIAGTDAKNLALREAAKALRSRMDELLEANKRDVDSVADSKPESFIDRLRLTEDRVEGMASALEEIAELDDPVGRVLATFERPNGLEIQRVAVPIGVIGMIYESRPNVGADASALCLKSGNAVILRGGSESRHSTRVIVECMQAGLKAADLPGDAVQTIQTTDRAAVAALLEAVEHVDLVIPRGGRGLVELVRDKAKVPTLLHLDGNCHSYVHEAADLDKAAEVIRNAKLRRTGVCGATESVVVDKAVAQDFIPRLAEIMGNDCELRGDETAVSIDGRITPASDEDWGTEYLDPIASVKVVDGIDQAIDWVSTYSSHHTDAIMTEDDAAAKRFMDSIDSAIVMRNASTQFADGGEFGMGAEIGIATGKMHARGPVGLEQLCSFKYLVHGDGQTRPA